MLNKKTLKLVKSEMGLKNLTEEYNRKKTREQKQKALNNQNYCSI